MTGMFQATALQQRQTLALTQLMRMELKLLQMDQIALVGQIAEAVTDNPFLRRGALPHGGGTATSDGTELLQAPDSLTDDLMRQVGELRMSRSDRGIATVLVHSVDDDGYLRETLGSVATICGSTPLAVARVLGLLQALTPVGVFARDLAECLRLQLMARNRFDALIAPLLSRLELVADRDVARIMALCGVDQEDAVEMIADILALSPRPVVSSNAEVAAAVIPDLVIVSGADGLLQVALNPDALPRIIADDALLSDVLHRAKTAECRDYIRAQYRHAAWLVTALAKRADTMLAIGKELARLQTKFLRSNQPEHRNALCMADVAAELGMHKSTISRALRGRIILTDQGRLDALSCFARRINGDALIATPLQALERIRKLIATEKPGAARSDSDLTFILSHSGLAISRRTVAKYRGILNIPPASVRNQSRVPKAVRVTE